MMWLKELLFTGFYTGYFPFASGTAGALVGMSIYIMEYKIFGNHSWVFHLVFVVTLLYPAVKLGDAGEQFFKRKDPSEIVFDEMMGYWITVLFYPFNWKITVIGFFIFRIMDIVKPYPANKFQDLKGGLGVMVDDYVAGIYSNIILLIIVLVSGCLGAPIYK